MCNVFPDTTTKITAYEDGKMSAKETQEFFAELIKSGLCWKLQGRYGRIATDYIDNGYIKTDGTILKEVEEIG